MGRIHALAGLFSAAGLLTAAVTLAPAQDPPIPLFSPEPISDPEAIAGTVTANIASARSSLAVPESSGQRVFLPLPQPLRDATATSQLGESVSLVVRDVALNDVLAMIAAQHELSLEAPSELSERVTLSIYDVSLPEALEILLQPRGYIWNRDAQQLSVAIRNETKPEVAPKPSVRVFPLAYLTRADIESTVQDLLSEGGKSRFTEIARRDNRPRTELVVIDDAEAIDRIERYLSRADQPPPHVAIDVQVLRVNLNGGSWQGINLLPLAAELSGQPDSESTHCVRFGDEAMETVVRSLRTAWHAEPLASPQMLVVSGERAGMQVANPGLTLQVTPSLASDHRLRLKVNPQLAGGQIDPATGQPGTAAAMETTLLVKSGETLVLSGLIQQQDVEYISKRRVLGDLPVIGGRFQQRFHVPTRTEVLIVLAARIVPEALSDAVARVLD